MMTTIVGVINRIITDYMWKIVGCDDSFLFVNFIAEKANRSVL